MVQDSKNTLDQILEGFKRESARLLRLKNREYNVAVIGCGDVGQEIIKQLVCDDRVDNLVISNKFSKKEAKWVADVTNTIDMPYEGMGNWLGGFEKDGKDIDLDVVIMTAGPFEMNRAKGLIENAKAMDEFATAAKDAKYKGLTMIFSNPVAALCFQYAVTTGNDPYSIVGFNPDPNRATKRLFAYLKDNHVEELRSNDVSEEELRREQEFVKSLQDDKDIQGFRLVGAHTAYSESEKDGEKVPCRLGIWKEATVKGRKISELGTFREISKMVPEWIIEEHGKEHVKTEKGEHKGSPRHAIVMKEHFFPMIDGEVEGMGPIVFDAKRGIWAARPANFMFHRAQPLSDKDAGIVGEVRKGYDDVCNYYIIKDCIDGLVANGFVDKNEAIRYVAMARSVKPPEDKEKRFGQRAEMFIEEKRRELDSVLRRSELLDEEKIEERKRFKALEEKFRKDAGLKFPVNMGYIYAVSKNQNIVYRVKLSADGRTKELDEKEVHREDKTILGLDSDKGGLCVAVYSAEEEKESDVYLRHSYSIKRFDFGGVGVRGVVDIPIDLSLFSVCGDDIYATYFDHDEARGQIVKISDKEDVDDSLDKAMSLGQRASSLQSYVREGKKVVLVSKFGDILQIDGDNWKKEEKKYTTEGLEGSLTRIKVKDNLVFASGQSHVYFWDQSDGIKFKDRYESIRGVYAVYSDSDCSVLVTVKGDNVLQVRQKQGEGKFENFGEYSLGYSGKIVNLQCSKDYIAVFRSDENKGIVHFYMFGSNTIEDTRQEFVLENIDLNEMLFSEEVLK